MSLFFVDAEGDEDLLQKNDEVVGIKAFTGTDNEKPLTSEVCDVDMVESEDEENVEYFGIPPPSIDIAHIIDKALSRVYITENEEPDDKVESLADFMGWMKKKTKQLGKTDVPKEMQSSVLRGIEDKEAIPLLSEKKLREQRKKEREKTKGKDWFNMPATEVTEEVENDLKILQMRKALDPKHFYKKNDLKVLPKYFQIGTIQHSPLDYYSERETRRNKHKTMVDELLANAEFQKYNKRKFKEIIEKRTKHRKAMAKMKMLKKKKK